MEILQLAISGWFARALAVAARLEIADILDGGSMTAAEIAKRTETDPQVLYRLLQMLTVPGVVERVGDEFRLSDAYAPLRADHPFTQRHFAIVAAELYDDAFAGLMHTVKTGRSGFKEVFGESLYEYLETHPEAADLFDKGMVDLAGPVGACLVAQHDFTGVATVVDVGGGSGGLLTGLLTANPDLRGIVADRASVCARGPAALARVADRAVIDRISFTPSDFFVEVPAAADRYVLKNVLHDWTYDNCVRILRTVATAMADGPAGARLLVVEPLVENDIDGWRAMFQAVACDEGTLGLDEPGMRRALAEAGLTVESVTPLPTGHKVLESSLRPA
ncbi:methyltransferase [Micromonospora sp. NBC_01699]|uniref:methyltransferase n=1 Tax=Micromonospora sp. NBC_01699 TaxID=2975984 RepID=UPI002E37844D|nr:methyltransferase [Micromonospora sp. NBC_01699]